MVTPPAEVECDEALVRALLTDQHPDLAGLPLVEVDAGWDNTLWRLGDDLAVRLPRRSLGARLTAHEHRWLPDLAPRLPLPVPVPVRLGRPGRGLPWVWSVVPWFAGAPADVTGVADPRDAATRLGGFLRALHAAAPPDAPTNAFRGVPLADRVAVFEERFARVPAGVDAGAVRSVWERALAADPWNAPPRWLHGDLHPGNILIAGGTIAAVIDFGDLCAGDPATDLAGAVMLLPRSAWAAFAVAYGGIDDATRTRTFAWAVLFALLILPDGPTDRPGYERVARTTLARATG